MEAAERQGPDASEAEGLQIAREVIAAIRPRVQGIQLTRARSGGELCLRLLREVAEREGNAAGVG